MKRALVGLAVAVLFLAALPLTAQTGSWTAVASTGVVDESAVGIYAFGTTGLSYSTTTASTAAIVARYNVTNTWGMSDTPPWSTLELGYFDNSPSSAVRADFFQVNPCTGVQTLLCSVTSVDSSSSTCMRCSFTTPVNFANNLYYVQVTLSRSVSTVLPAAFTLRIR